MAERVIYESLEGRRGVRVTQEGEFMQFMTTRNGSQWAGVPVDRDMLLRMHAAIESVLAVPNVKKWPKEQQPDGSVTPVDPADMTPEQRWLSMDANAALSLGPAELIKWLRARAHGVDGKS